MAVMPFVMVLIGCPQGTAACEPIATMPVAYANEATCMQARADILSVSHDLGYARVVAECRPQGSQLRREAKAPAQPTA